MKKHKPPARTKQVKILLTKKQAATIRKLATAVGMSPATFLRRLIANVGMPGECIRCGCTDDAACPGGCSWANDERTICTGCVS